MSTSPSKRSKPSRVLGARAFAAITAVEGLQLGPESRARLREMEAQGLAHDEQRAAVLKAYRSTRPGG